MEYLVEGNERKVLLYLLKNGEYHSIYSLAKEIGIHRFSVSKILSKFEKMGVLNNKKINKNKVKIIKDNEYLRENLHFLVLGVILASILTLSLNSSDIILGAFLVFLPQASYILKNYYFNENMWKIYIVNNLTKEASNTTNNKLDYEDETPNRSSWNSTCTSSSNRTTLVCNTI